MKKQYLLLIFTIIFLCFGRLSHAQMVGGNAFLQGTYLEIGEENNGALGAPNPPATYHPHQCCGSPGPTPGVPLAEVYDYGHDGWAVGAPAFMGDYTYPGSPFEGWEVQMNGVRSQQYQGGGYSYSGAATMTTPSLTYASGGGRFIGNWFGNFNNGATRLSIVQETRVDVLASAVVFTTKFYNTSGSTANAVYYWRSCDPDNDETWTGGSFTTDNIINFQNATVPNPTHKVMVTATGRSATRPPLTLCTKDCRAVAVIYNSWGLTVGQDLAAVWSQTYGPAGSGAYYNVGVNHPGDIGIGLVYNLGSIASGDSAIISYAYVFNGPAGIDDDGALPDPLVHINGDTIRNYPDTLNACDYPGVDSIPFNVIFGDDKDWSWSTWTWEPSTGLTGSGTHHWLHLGWLPGGAITYTITGHDSMNDCATKVFMFTVKSCHQASSNAPCEGDTLQLRMGGDSLGATYAWTGPHSFTSTKHNPFIFPASMADTGWYKVIKTTAGVRDTDSTHVVIHPRPDITASSNSPLCANQIDTLHLFVNPASPGDVFNWTGPGGFGSGLQNPTVFGLTPPTIALGTYTVVATSAFGCKDTAYTNVDTISQPRAPIITGPTPYCQYETFVPFTVSGLGAGAVVWWYPSALGLPGTTIPSVVNTAVVGYTTVWASQKIGSCESPRGNFTVRVITTPPAPGVTYTHDYCQYIGPVDTIIATHTATGVLRWYTAAVGGSFTLTQPIPDITRVPAGGSYLYWVSQIDSGCEGLRTPITITIHPKPNPPVVQHQEWCQFRTPGPAIADPSGAGDILTWYGPGVTPGMSAAPTPSTLTAPDTIVYYVTETTSFGCISDSAIDRIVIKVKPQPPLVSDIKYCQEGRTVPLNGQVDSAHDSHLNWYYNAVPLDPPVYPLGMNPITDTTPGTYTYYVSQTVPNSALGCESDSAALNVTIIYKPVIDIAASQPYVCQFDSIRLSYSGSSLFAPDYYWTLPAGAYFADRTHKNDSTVIVKFDSAILNNYVTLIVTNDSGFCSDTAITRIKIVTQPIALAYGRPDVCLGDTVSLALAFESADAYNYIWSIDKVPMSQSMVINVVSSNSHSGGPFTISWIDSGRHVIEITSFSKEGCRSEAYFDTINVHTIPDAAFNIITGGGTICIEDSVKFAANNQDYKNSFNWTPAHFFNNENTPTIWGRVEQLRSTITLTVTDPFGCVATSSKDIDPQPCCTVVFPNAFTPNGDKINNLFRPICSGFHRFHVFRIVNRWGQTVYQTSNTSDAAWDGNYNGVPQDIGTYFYFLKYDCGGKTMEAKGDVTLIR